MQAVWVASRLIHLDGCSERAAQKIPFEQQQAHHKLQQQEQQREERPSDVKHGQRADQCQLLTLFRLSATKLGCWNHGWYEPMDS